MLRTCAASFLACVLPMLLACCGTPDAEIPAAVHAPRRIDATNDSETRIIRPAGLKATDDPLVDTYSSKVLGRDVPVTYRARSRGLANVLEVDHLEKVVAGAVPLRPENQRVWFVSVGSVSTFWDVCGDDLWLSGGENTDTEPQQIEMKNTIDVAVFFTPESNAAELRKGHYAGYRGGKVIVTGATYTYVPVLRDYCQVCLSPTPFDDDLFLPKGAHHPFRRPEGMADETIISLVRTWRMGLEWSSVLQSPPLISIQQLENNEFEVVAGWHEGSLAGMLRVSRLRKTEEGFLMMPGVREVYF